MNRLRNGVWVFVLGGAGLTGAALLALFAQPFERARAWVNPLSKDGSLELFSAQFYQSARTPVLAAGAFLLLVAVAMLIWRSGSLNLTAAVLRQPGRLFTRLRRDAACFWADLRGLRLSRREALLLAGLVFIAILARGAFLWRPLEHDEAYTVETFAAPPLHVGLVDYHLPNNHVFHTFLVHYVFQVFGYQVWAVRLPALLAGVLVVVAIYFLARRLYDAPTAALAAGGSAVLPVLIYFGTNARGYTLLTLFALLMILLAEYVRRRANLLAWSLWVLFAALGFLTVPVFLFAFSVVGVWLALAMFFEKDLSSEYGPRLHGWTWLAAAGLAAGALTLLLYTPVFLHSGFDSVFAKTTLMPTAWDQYSGMLHARLDDIYIQFLDGVPLAVQWALAVGFLLSLTPLPGRLSQNRAVPPRGAHISWKAATIIALGLMLLIQRPNPWPRFFTFLIPLVLMWSAAGWVGLLRWVQVKTRLHWNLAGSFTAVVLLAMLVATGLRTLNSPISGWQVHGQEEQAVLYLRGQMQPQDLIVTAPPQDAVVWYYSRLHGFDMDHYKRELPFFRAFVLVDLTFGQSIQSVMEERGPEAFFFDWNTARVVFQAGSLQVYQIDPYADLIRREYHLK